jgi:hypothetical protein
MSGADDANADFGRIPPPLLPPLLPVGVAGRCDDGTDDAVDDDDVDDEDGARRPVTGTHTPTLDDADDSVVFSGGIDE